MTSRRLSLRRALQSLGRLGAPAALVMLSLPGCGREEAGAPLPGRREAVLAQPGAAVATAAPGTAAGTTPKVAAATVPPEGATRSGPLCASDAKPRKAESVPLRQVSAEGTSEAVPFDFGGGSWQWVNLWAAWCAPCLAEIPLLQRWEREFGGTAAAFRLQLISLDDDERQLSNLLRQEKVPGLRGSSWLPEGESRDQWLRQVGVGDAGRLPVHLLIDGSGTVRCRIEGELREGDEEAVRRLLRSPGR